MSVWVRAICRNEVPMPTAEALRQGILERLNLLFALYEPDSDERETARQLKVARDANGERFSITYEQRQRRPLILEPWSGPRARQEASELVGEVEEGNAADREEVLTLLDSARQIVGIDVGAENAQGEGWPVAIAAAAWYADVGGGLIQADGAGWLRPVPGQVAPLFVDD